MEQFNILQGKKLVVIGDSMVQGHCLSDEKKQTWVAKIAERNGMRHKNYGINGTALAYQDVYDGECPREQSVVGRYASMDDDADYILVFSGTNDIHNAVPLGEDDSTDPATFKGALNFLCEKLIEKYPTGKIGFITPYTPPYDMGAWRLAPLYVDAIVQICARHSISVFDNSKNGGINWTNQTHVAALTLGDTTHLSEAGMEFVSTRYEAFLRSL